MTDISNLVHFREPREEDINFILNSWLKSQRWRYQVISNEQYYNIYRQHIITLLQSSKVTIATTEDSNQIVGYIVTEDQCIHYLYVKYCYRKMGVARLLLNKVDWKYQSIDPRKDRFCNILLLRR